MKKRVGFEFFFQRTIRKEVECTGIGLHSGNKVRLVLHPAPVDHGIKFKVVFRGKEITINPSPFLVIDTSYATCLGYENFKLCTVEHLLAAIRGLGIDNILVEVHGNEVPIMDGSSSSFVYLLKEAEPVNQSKYKRFYAIKRHFYFKDSQNNRWIKAYPYKGFKIRYTVIYNHPFIGKQQLVYENSEENFVREIAKARTFGFLSEVELLKEKELIKGGSLDNALVFDDNGVINKDGMRFNDEPVRHKILDFIGDTNLLEYPLLGFFDVFCSGHKLNNLFLRDIYRKKEEFLLCIDLNQKSYKIFSGFSEEPVFV